MNSKMTINSQLLTTKPKKKTKKPKKQPKETTRTGTEPQKWRSHGGLLMGGVGMREKVQGIRSINGTK